MFRLFSKSILQIFLDFAYLLCLSPFRLKVEKLSGRYRVQKWMPHQVLCGFGHLLSTIVLFTEAIQSFNAVRQNKTPEAYFTAFYGATNLTMTILVIRWLWKKQELAVRVVTDVQAATNIERWIDISLVIFTLVSCVVAAMLTVASFLLGTNLFPTKLWTPKYWWTKLILSARERFLGYKNFKIGEEPDVSKMPLFHKLLAVLLGVGSFFRFLTRFYEELMLLIGILCFWRMSYSFSRSLRKENMSWKEMIRKYKHLKDFSKCFNMAYGELVFFYVWNSVLLYSTRLDTLFTSEDDFFRYRALFFYASSILFFFFSADCCRQAQYVRTWLTKDDNLLKVGSDSALQALLNSAFRNTIAVSGLGTFNITYGFIANVSGLVVTYFMICIE